jgi:conjugative transfer signal peptidase TraF
MGFGAAHGPVLIWNASASSPRGLYVIEAGEPGIGDFVVAWPPNQAAALAAARGYLPRGVPLVKTVVAGAGDRVCAGRKVVWVNGDRIAVRQPADRAGQALPSWSGCRTLAFGQVLVLGLGDRASFDGRYFGPIGADRVLGRARLLWRA